MLAMQYTVNLPSDYDMETIRQRVRDRAEGFDTTPGLGLKAFTITERANGADTNRYAPFYLWCETAHANEFLSGERFAGVSDSFGRPLVEHWIGMHFRTGSGGEPRSATREDLLVHHDEDLATLTAREREWLDGSAEDERGLFAAAVALDPYRWRLVRFALWQSARSEYRPVPVTAYEVLHLSRPGLDQLRRAA